MGCTSSRDASTDGAIPPSHSQDQTRTSTASASRSALPIPRTSAPNDASPLSQPPTTTAAPPPTKHLRLKSPRPWKSSDHPPPHNPSLPTPSTPSHRWTHALLARERAAFFDTRVTGSAQIWQTIQLAVEMGRDGGDWRGAGSVLEAAGCSVSRGRLEEGVWDERGALYPVPVWVCSAPMDVAQDVVTERQGQAGVLGVGGGDGEGEVTEGEDEVEGGVVGEKGGLAGVHDGGGGIVMAGEKEKVAVLGMQEAGKGKGKERSSGVAKPKDPIKIRARLSDRGTDVVVLVDKEDSVKSVVRKLVDEADMPSETKIRLCYMGKMLSPDSSLPSQGWQPGHVVQALVFG